MPGVELSDPIETLPILDRPLLKAHKQLPRRPPVVYPSPPSHQGAFEPPQDLSYNDDGSVNGSTTSSAPSTAINNPPGLPLTPPSAPQEMDENIHASPLHGEVNTLIQTPRSTGMRTPVNQRSPPTPDNTPPRNTKSPRALEAPLLQPSLSSRAESFKTAREDLSSDDENPETPSLIGPTQHWLKELHPARQAEVRRSLGLKVEDGDVTPKERAPRKLWENEAFNAFDGQWSRPPEVKKVVISDVFKADTKSAETSPVEKKQGMDPKPEQKLDASPVEMKQVINLKPDTKPEASPTEVKQTEIMSDRKPPGTPPMETSPISGKGATIENLPNFKKIRKLRPEPDNSLQSSIHAGSVSLPDRAVQAEPTLKRDRSLRERIQDSNQLHTTPSIEKFGDEIGWSPTSDNSEKVNSWRFSTISATSTTVEAVVIDTPPQRKRTLRHFDKNPALRSASSPIPRSNRTSMNSNVDSLHRLVHKTGKITNENRWSLNSDISPIITSSNPVPQQPETIAVVVIPQRRSSLKSSASSSRRPSQSSGSYMSGTRPVTAPEAVNGYFDTPPRRRKTSGSNPSAAGSINDERVGTKITPHVPARSSSLSAPTSRNNSRAASMTSESGKIQDALPMPRPQPTEVDPPERLSKALSESTNPQEWQGLRPPSSQFTPFSQPSVQSSSPGPVEISEATAVSLFPHNNRSLLVVEKRIQPESRAVQELQKHTRGLALNVEAPTTPRMDVRPPSIVDSPLKNPREPPKPPAFKIIPPTPAAATPSEEADRQLGKRPQTSDGRTGLGRRFNSVRRAFSARRHSDSFSSPFTRSLSLRTTARNKKRGEDLDSNLHPFWRPRGFWDDFSESDSDEVHDDDIIVNNSLGMPQKRIIFDGPLSLVRRISNPTRRPAPDRVVRKTVSYGSLVKSRLRPGKKVYTIPGLGLHFQFMGWKEWQSRIQKMKERKEEERREKQRERLRQSIGQHRVVHSDSRYV
jgi:hypothetical protein